ncbi:hypothetical protein, partial [Streptomyces sp. CRN 30]|uniref:hypothetical protein n=1 Tax=Streptomyces sp. CRN 30 TaxID=3075613 RepID=UPI002A7F5EC4
AAPAPADDEPAPPGPTRPAPPARPEGNGNGTAPTDWWQAEDSPWGDGARAGDRDRELALGDLVPGFVGGVEIPELLKPSFRKTDAADAAEGKAGGQGTPGGAVPRQKGAAVAVEAAVPVSAAKGNRLRVPRLRPESGWNNPLLLLAAALLVAGAFIGSLVPLILGWLIAYLSRRLSPNESKWAVFGVPGAAAVAGIVWLWGRTDGRWGDPIAEDQMGDAIAGTWPWVLRGAAVASAVYLVWRSQRAH